ncbi:ribonuclease H-like domain-containing protein [Tanacetum coccineum]
MTGGSGSNVDSISSLDADNLLHLQTNDNNSRPLINLKLNYRVWFNAMKIALQARNKMCFVDGTCTMVAYATSVPLSNQWEKCNVVVLSWLLSSIFDDMYLSQVYSENAVEFLMVLDDVYFPIRSSLLTQTELPDVKDTFVIVCRKESHRGLGSGTGVQKLTNYDMKGHTIDMCFEIIGYPNGFKRNQNGKNSSNNKGYSSNNVDVQKNSSGMPFISDQIAKLMSLIGDKPGNGIHANMAGANQHITSSTNNMKNVIDISELNITVGHPNGTTAKIRKVGNLKLTNNIVLFDVLVIPEYYDLKRENILGTGSEAEGLYVLGHPSDQVMSVLKNKLSIGKPTHAMPCEVCHHAKQVREPFLLSEHKSDALGSLIHLDLWGPYKVITRDGFNQASSPNDDGGEPSAGNIGSESESDDTAREQSSVDDQGSMHIGEEDFSEGNVFDNYDISTNLFNTEESNTRESNTLRRSSRQSKLPPKLNDYVLNNKSYEEAPLDKNWVQAMNEEMEALYKAMLVAKGFNQREGIDYEENFSPVVKMGTVRYVYMLPPPGYFDKNETRFCKLKRSLYGLKQAPGQWNNRLFEALVENEFKQSGHDHSLYTKESSGSFVPLLVYVDDIVLTGNNINEINKVKTFLKSKFKIKDLGELKYFLGTEVLRTEKDGLCLSQRKHCLELLYDYGLLACKPVSTPLPENIILAHKESKDDKFLKNITSYQRLVGKLIYLTLTRLDISYYVHCLSQHMQAPLQSYMDLGLGVLRYLKGASGSGVNYEKSKHMSLKVYAYSDWAKCPVTRRSVSGYCVFFNGCMVSWKSKKQATLSKSSAEAEYRSMAAATCELMWVVNILKDLKVTNLLSAELYCDNSATIQIAANPIMHEKTKQFDLDVQTASDEDFTNWIWYRLLGDNLFNRHLIIKRSGGLLAWCQAMAPVLAMAHHSVVRAKASRLWLTTPLNSGAIPNLVPNSIFLTFFSMARAYGTTTPSALKTRNWAVCLI